MSNGVTAWSYSRYADYEQCPAKFKYKVLDKLKEPDSPAFAKGIAWHKMAEDFLRGQVTTLPNELRKFARQFEELRELQPFVEQEWGFTTDWRSTGYFAKDTWLRAKIDAGVIYEDQKAEAVDHKTGKKYATNLDQIELFSLTVMCRYPMVTHVTARLWYLETGDEVIEEFSAKDREKLKAKWDKKVVPLFSDTNFAPRPNDKCKWCHFRRDNGGPCKF